MNEFEQFMKMLKILFLEWYTCSLQGNMVCYDSGL